MLFVVDRFAPVEFLLRLPLIVIHQVSGNRQVADDFSGLGIFVTRMGISFNRWMNGIWISVVFG